MEIICKSQNQLDWATIYCELIFTMIFYCTSATKFHIFYEFFCHLKKATNLYKNTPNSHSLNKLKFKQANLSVICIKNTHKHSGIAHCLTDFRSLCLLKVSSNYCKRKNDQCYNVRSFVCIFFSMHLVLVNDWARLRPLWKCEQKEKYTPTLFCKQTPSTSIHTSSHRSSAGKGIEPAKIGFGQSAWFLPVYGWVCVCDTHAHHRKRAELGLLLHSLQYLHLRLGVCVCAYFSLFWTCLAITSPWTSSGQASTAAGSVVCRRLNSGIGKKTKPKSLWGATFYAWIVVWSCVAGSDFYVMQTLSWGGCLCISEAVYGFSNNYYSQKIT